MAELLSIGDFSRMTFLTVKALRHYHDVGLLEPARTDPGAATATTAPSRSPRPGSSGGCATSTSGRRSPHRAGGSR